MCGICGFVEKNGVIPSLTLIRDMMSSLNHRGPDSCGYYRDRNASLGHTRLSIIDLQSGAQPMTNEDGTLWISFNGEIFNYLELRDTLIARGHVFKTKSDTETIIHAWEEWGTDCFSRFNGQWAFALWNSVTKELIISRDRHGIRPLYYTNQKNRFLFASEIKALYCDNEVDRAFDPEGMTEIFTYWSPLAPASAYRDICEIPPGCFGRLKNEVLHIEPYWTISFESRRGKSEGEHIENLREKLIEASRLRFTRSDVPVGAYLSGGIDSSVISAIVARYTTTQLKTFSLRFQDSEFDEGFYQKEMSRRLDTEHHDIVVSSRDIGEIFPEVVFHAERPILRTAPAPLFLLSRLVRKSGIKVVVTGEGADEVLGGYDIFREAKVRRTIASSPDSPDNFRMIEQLYPWMERSPASAPAFAKSFFSRKLDPNDPFLSHRPRWETASGILKMFNPDFLEGRTPDLAVNGLERRLPENFLRWKPLERDQWLEYTTLLPGYILSAQGDRMLMGNSVEGRFPFLDCDLVETANNLPDYLKLKDLTEKYILKEAYKDILPESILKRPKQPYRAPDAQSFFFNSGKLEWLDDVLSEDLIREAGIFQFQMVDRFFDKCRKNRDRKMSNTDNMRAVGIITTMLNYKFMIKGEWSGKKIFTEPSVSVDLV
ncbi:MAG: asparagine synthase (glutamine-hydrolyzing) [Spirochaetales bacterium]|nr:asparagine synthase (glutamine-hydrolyzing) [Spirochaetales bacterium]